MSQSKWLIVWCAQDQSYSLINEAEAITDEEILKTGDSVKFVFAKKLYEGEVRHIGADQDYKLDGMLDELRASLLKESQEGSFHAELPRKNRGNNMKTAVAALVGRKRSSPTEGSKIKKRPAVPSSSKKVPAVQVVKSGTPLVQPKSILDKVLNSEDITSSDSDGEATINLVNASPPSSPPPETLSGKDHSDHNKIKRLKTVEGRSADLKVLKGKHDKQSEPTSGSSKSSGAMAAFENSSKLDARQVYGAFDSPPESDTEDESQCRKKKKSQKGKDLQKSSEKKFKDDARKTGKKKNGDKPQKTSDNETDVDEMMEQPDYDINDEKGDGTPDKEDKQEGDQEGGQLRWTDEDFKDSKKKLVKVKGKGKDVANRYFYITGDEFRDAKLAPNASTFARCLLVAAFSDRALYQCSLRGGQFRAGGRANITQKPKLDQDVLAIILEVAFARQTTKKWKYQSRKELLSTLSMKLVEIRPRLKKIFDP